jgi:branched-chain amino acid aminotransferase
MKDFTGIFCIIDDRAMKKGALNRISLPELTFCYEVIRVDDGIMLFLEDHLSRLRDSVKNIDKFYKLDYKYIINILLKLKVNNGLHSGNVKLLIGFHRGIKRDPLFIAYQVLHRFPTEKQYREGIMTSLFAEERKKPNMKYINTSLQEKCRNEIIKRDVYELLLVDHDGYITEGSKSNIFLIKEGILYTSPANRVLKGITREKIIGICKESGYPLREENIPVNNLNQFNAVFITGTSPKILPVASIDTISFPVENPLIAQLKARYEALIVSYKTKICQTGYRIDFE